MEERKGALGAENIDASAKRVPNAFYLADERLKKPRIKGCLCKAHRQTSLFDAACRKTPFFDLEAGDLWFAGARRHHPSAHMADCRDIAPRLAVRIRPA